MRDMSRNGHHVKDGSAMSHFENHVLREIQLRTVAKRNGPGPFVALMYRKKATPTKRNMPQITEGCRGFHIYQNSNLRQTD